MPGSKHPSYQTPAPVSQTHTSCVGGPPRGDAGREASQYQRVQSLPTQPGRATHAVAARRPSHNSREDWQQEVLQ